MVKKKQRLVASFSQVIPAVLLVALMAFLAGCSRSETEEAQAQLPPGGVLLTGAGATFPSVLYNRWFSVYHDSHPNTFIRYAAVGSEKAFAASLERTLRMGKGSTSGRVMPPCPTRRSHRRTIMR